METKVCRCLSHGAYFRHTSPDSATQYRHSRLLRHRRTRERCCHDRRFRRLGETKITQRHKKAGETSRGALRESQSQNTILRVDCFAEPLTTQRATDGLSRSLPMLLALQMSIMSTVTLSSSTHGAEGSMQAKSFQLPPRQARSSSTKSAGSHVHSQQLHRRAA